MRIIITLLLFTLPVLANTNDTVIATPAGNITFKTNFFSRVEDVKIAEEFKVIGTEPIYLPCNCEKPCNRMHWGQKKVFDYTEKTRVTITNETLTLRFWWLGEEWTAVKKREVGEPVVEKLKLKQNWEKQ